MALQWTPLRLMMTGGDSRVSKHHHHHHHRTTTADLLLDLKRRSPQMLDKAVQSTTCFHNSMDGDDSNATAFATAGGDSVTAFGDKVTSFDMNATAVDKVTSFGGDRSTSSFGDKVTSFGGNVSAAGGDRVTSYDGGNVTAVGGKDSVSSNVTVAEINSPVDDGPIYSRPSRGDNLASSNDSGLVADDGCATPDAVDAATLQLRPKHVMGSSAKNNAEDEIKEQTPPLLANNSKLLTTTKDFDEKAADGDNTCALECLAFTLECCQCVVL